MTRSLVAATLLGAAAAAAGLVLVAIATVAAVSGRGGDAVTVVSTLGNLCATAIAAAVGVTLALRHSQHPLGTAVLAGIGGVAGVWLLVVAGAVWGRAGPWWALLSGPVGITAGVGLALWRRR